MAMAGTSDPLVGHLLRLWPWVTIGFRWKKAERWRAGIFPIPMSEASDPLGAACDGKGMVGSVNTIELDGRAFFALTIVDESGKKQPGVLLGEKIRRIM